MRFDKIVAFSIDNLILDENNYRLTKSQDQIQALLKIYHDAPDNFINMMTSIAEDDLGEPLLVYQDDKGQFIIADGNRRSAALKALKNPELTGVVRIINKAEQLNNKHEVKFDNILAQVSNDKNLIFKTIYERHAAGKGRSRIGWAALGAARFRYEQEIDDGQQWYSVPLIFEVESLYPEHAEYINSNKYSHETFRRIINAAIKRGYIEKSLFDDNKMQVNKKNNKRKWDKIINLTSKFISSMKKGEINLSRGESYADKSTIDKYLDQFEAAFGPHQTTKGTEGQDTGTEGQDTGTEDQDTGTEGQDTGTEGQDTGTEGQDTGTGDQDTGTGDQDTTGTGDQDTTGTEDQDTGTEGQDTGTEGQDTGTEGQDTGKAKRPKAYTKIPRSEPIAKRLALHDDFYKLSFLYHSICSVSAEEHCTLVSVGCWSFCDTLSTILNKSEKDSFVGFFNNKLNRDPVWTSYFKGNEIKDIRVALAYILEHGNSSKHSKKDFCLETATLINKFRVLESLIIFSLQLHLDEKLKS